MGNRLILKMNSITKLVVALFIASTQTEQAAALRIFDAGVAKKAGTE